MNRTAARTLAGLILSLLSVGCLAASNNAAISLSGQVVDEAGNPLQQVQLYERSNRFNIFAESFLSSSTSDRELGDGRFQISCRRCSSINLSFSKPGYYSETVDFHTETTIESDSRLALEVAEDLELTDLRIVLRSAQNQVRLNQYDGFLQASASGPVTVLPLRRGLGSRGVTLERLIQASPKRDSDPGGYILMIAELNQEGELAERPQPPRPGARMAVPASATLDFGELDGGIILHRQTSENSRDVYRAMSTAPENDYQKTLELSTDPNAGDFYFYCRIGDLYGKGRVKTPSFSHADDGQEVVMSYIEIRLNMQGSRNLETAN